MKILLTGASSFLGEHTVRALVERGDNVVVFQRRAAPIAHTLGLEQHLGDVCDYTAVSRACAGVDVVVHAAAKVGVVGTRKEFVNTNIWGSVTVVEAAQAAQAAGVVYISSPSVAHTGAALVGAGAGRAQPGKAHGWYSKTKSVAELLMLERNCETFHTVALRPHLVWGPGDTQLVGRIVSRAKAGKLFRVGGGTSLVDTTYVDNAVGAIVRAVDTLEDSTGGQALMVSNGQPRTVAELFDKFCAAAGVDGPTRNVPTWVAYSVGAGAEALWGVGGWGGDPPMTRFLATQLGTAHWFSLAHTRQILRWEPTVSLDEGFAHLGAWYGNA